MQTAVCEAESRGVTSTVQLFEQLISDESTETGRKFKKMLEGAESTERLEARMACIEGHVEDRLNHIEDSFLGEWGDFDASAKRGYEQLTPQSGQKPKPKRTQTNGGRADGRQLFPPDGGHAG